jgi:predicted transposase YbfD/YdcC
MSLKVKPALVDHFSAIPDPRLDRQKRHKLIDILTIAICAVICGADDWVAVEAFGKARLNWLKTFLELPNGIPSHDTFGRVFSLLPPEELQGCFLNWIRAVYQISKGQIIPIDGKTLRHSYDRGLNKGAIHMISAWASKNRVVLGQLKTEEKSNEITAIPELLQVLDIQGCIVTIDAMGCQKKIADEIIKKDADYVLGLKANQGTLFKEVKAIFDKIEAYGGKEGVVDYYETEETDHGRMERRRYWVIDNIDGLTTKDLWTNLNTVGLVKSVRTVDGETQIERRYYIASIEKDAQLFAKAVRSHWGIENSVHWVLDVAFREDDCRVRKGHAPENLATLRHIALNLLRANETVNLGIKNKRLTAGWNSNYLANVLSG